MVFFKPRARAVALAYLGGAGPALEDASIAASMCLPVRGHRPGRLRRMVPGEAFELAGDEESALKHIKRGAQMGARYNDARLLGRARRSVVAFLLMTWSGEGGGGDGEDL